MLERAYDNFIVPLETFRKDQVGQVKERKKKFDKQTAKFCASQERYLGLSTKKQDNVLQEVSVERNLAKVLTIIEAAVFDVLSPFKSNVVKLRQGSGKDRQGMAVKAKGLKA